MKHVALMRGINVGGKNKLPMKDLAAMFVSAGCRDVTTYIASGNVAFTASDKIVGKLATVIAARIAKDLGLTIPVVLRSADELAGVVTRNPFAEADPATLALMFLATAPTKAQIAALDPRRSPGDVFAVVGRDVYLQLGNGFADTKLTNGYFDTKLATVSTARSWRTVGKLIAMSR